MTDDNKQSGFYKPKDPQGLAVRRKQALTPTKLKTNQEAQKFVSHQTGQKKEKASRSQRVVGPRTIRQRIESSKSGLTLSTSGKPETSAKLEMSTASAPAPPSVFDLARALNYDIDLIYEWVYSNVDFYPMWGMHKGEQGTMIDCIGGSMEQASLMVLLLQEASTYGPVSYEPISFIKGQIRLSKADVEQWLGTNDDTVHSTSEDLLKAGQIPCTANYNMDGTLNYIDVSQVWVQATIGGNAYVFDPSYKNYSYATCIDLSPIIDYDASALIGAAEDGAAVTSESMLKLNTGNINDYFKTYGTNLLSWIQTNAFSASMQDIIGGRTIQPLTGMPVRQATVPHQISAMSPVSALPSSDFATLRVQMTGMDHTFNTADIYSQNVSIVMNDTLLGYLAPLLGVNEGLVAAGSEVPSDVLAEITLTITHPFSTTDYDETWTQGIYTNAGSLYIICTAFGPSNQAMVDSYRHVSQFWAANGEPEGNPRTLGNSLEVYFFMNFVQTCQMQAIYNQLASCTHLIYHFAGIGGYNTLVEGPYFDFQGIQQAAISRVGDTDTANNVLLATEIVANGFEGGIIQQNLAIAGVDTQALLDAANTDEQLIFYADSSNWMSSIRSQLVNWDAYLTEFDARIAAGFTLLIHQDGETSVGSFIGGGLYQLLLAPTAPTLPSASGLITGGLKGVVVPFPVSIAQVNYSNYNGPEQTDTQQFQPKSPDPVGLCAGNLYYNHDDLTVGSGNFPYSLTFSRSYNSNNCFVNGPIGLGWTHNYFTNASLGSNGLRACGEFSPKEAAATIAHSYVMIQLALNDSATITQLLIASQSTFWLMSQMASNSVTINDGGNSREYVLLVDGTTYNPAPGYVETLTLSGGAYTLTNPQQQKWIFNTDGTLATYVDPAALTGSTYTLSLSYSGGLLTSVTNGLGRTLSFSYSGFVLQSVSDGNGRSVTLGYDTHANLTLFTDTTGATIRYDYNLVENLPGLLAQIFLPDNPSSAVMSTSYDEDLIVQQQSSANFFEPELTTNFQFAGSRTATIDPLGNTFARYTNSLGSVVREINELGQVTSYEYDGLNRVISITYPELNQLLMTYDNNNNVLTKTWVAKPGSSLPNIVQMFTYDSTWNRLATFKDGEGNITTYAYDATQGTLLSITRPTIGGLTPTVVFTYNSRGQVLTRTDETGIVDFLVYDSSTEVLQSSTRDYGTGHLNLITAFDYDAIGNVVSITDPRGNETTFAFDTERRMTQKTDPAPFNFVTSWDYSANGWRTAIHRQNSGLTQSWAWAYLYNGLVSATTDPAGNQVVLGYDTLWRLISRTDAESREYQFAYDLLSRISTITDPMDNTSETRTYTDNGMLASTEDALTNVTAYEYDGFDRLAETTYPDASTEQYSYNANNQVLTLDTRKGDTITNTYDVLLRLATRQPGSLSLQTYSYDLAGRLTNINTPTSGTDPASGDYGYSYDGAGRLYLQTTPDGKTITYVLDENGNRTKLTYPDGFYVNYVYDQLNRLTDIALTTFLPSVHFDYDELSRRTAITYDNLCVCTYAYELNNDMASLEHAFNDASSVKFGFDSNKVHQVIATTSTDPSYLWSPSGSSTKTYGTANNLNQYPSVNGAPFSYDNNGCLTGGLLTATFDALNRMTQAVSGSTTNDYWYDPLNRQAQKTVNGTKTGYLNDGQQLLATYDGSGALVNRYIRGDGLNEVFMYIHGSTKVYLHYDRLGSVIAESDSVGAVSHKYTYGLFGETASVSNSSFGFTGQRYDGEIGLYNYRARYYSPSIGRFLQPDPIGYNAGMNLYSYVGNDPGNLTDPSGMVPGEKKPSWSIIPALQPLPLIVTGQTASISGSIGGVLSGNASNGGVIYGDQRNAPSDIPVPIKLDAPPVTPGTGPGPNYNPENVMIIQGLPFVAPTIQEYTPFPNDSSMKDMWGDQATPPPSYKALGPVPEPPAPGMQEELNMKPGSGG